MLRFPLVSLAVVVLVTLIQVCDVAAEVTPDQAKELRSLKTELAKVSGLLRKKEFDEATRILDEAATEVEKIMSAAAVEETDRRLQGVPQLIASRRKALELQQSKADGGTKPVLVSFVDDVAPIISEKCLGCHAGDNPRCNLGLDTFAGWKRGGQSGRLLTPGDANLSLLIARLIAPNPKERMPKNREPLSKEQITTIATWVNQGAPFDGDSEASLLGKLRKAKAMEDVVIPQPQGTETVSFTKDVAPMMVRLCIRCHSGNTPASGLSLETFEDIMIGGDSGEVILPGDRENSRLFRLVGGLENPRMPQGQARITRKNYEDLIKWFDEGNVFDGDNPKAPLVSLVPTEEQQENERFAKMSAEEFLAHRRQRTEEIWKRTLPNIEHQSIETDELLIVGDVSPQRLQQVEEWATSHTAKLRKTFDADDEPPWKGKLTIMVLKERFGFTEYALSILDRRAPDGMFGHSVVTGSHSDTYVVVQDVGDEPDTIQPGLKANLIEHLTAAFLQRNGPIPEWLARGGGLLMVAQDFPGSPYVKQIPQQALTAVAAVDAPRDLFDDGTFSPATVGPVGYALVEYLVAASGNAKLVRLVEQLQSGTNMQAAVTAVYGTSLDDLGRSFVAALRKRVD